MINGMPFTKYHLQQTGTIIKALVIFLTAVFILGNIITDIMKDEITVPPGSYIIKEGFPVFSSRKDYLSLVKNYPYDMGTKIKIHTIRNGESFWDIARQYKISLDTIIAANPWIDTLFARAGHEIVIPSEDGTLLLIDGISDISAMSEIFNTKYEVKGDYRHSIFELLALDEVRFAFFKDAKPVIVNNWLHHLFHIRRIFQTPLKGTFTSLYGHRSDPIFGALTFHNGVDIQARSGTPIYPVANGMVISSKWHDGYGLTITVQHNDGYISMYGHCLSSNVTRGDLVTRDTIIASVGSTGRSTGPHLHFLMQRHGQNLNPLNFIW